MYKNIILISLIFLIINCSSQNELTNPKYKIAFNVLVDSEKDNYDIFIMDFDGSNKKNITNHIDVAWVYSGFKDKIYFISDRDTCARCYFLYSMNKDGNNITKLTDFRLRDSWLGVRKNGDELIVNPHPKVDSVFYILNKKGEIENKINSGLVYFNDPVFSPDGKKIAFRGANKKFKKESGFIDEIYTMNSDGSEIKQLTHYPPNDTTAPWYSYKAGPPRFYPNGEFISYQSFQNGKYSLYAVTIDGKRQWKLTDNIVDEGWHDWSSDGKWLAIELFDTEQTQFNIGLMNWETKELKILTDTTYKYQQAPVFVNY